MKINSQQELEITKIWLEKFRESAEELRNSDRSHKLGTKLLITAYEGQMREFTHDIQEYENSQESPKPESCWRKIINKFNL